MKRAVFMFLCVLSAVAPRAAFAQSYQQYNDGLVAVTAKKVLESDQRVAFDVCAQLMRQEDVGPLHIRLNLWKAAGGFLRQLSSVLQPDIGTPVCQRIQVPQETEHFGRWEVAGFHFLREYAPHRAGRLDSAS